MGTSSVLSGSHNVAREFPQADGEPVLGKLRDEHSVDQKKLKAIMSTVPDSLSQLVNMGLLSNDDLSVCGEIPDGSDMSMDSLVDFLVERRKLTKYQADVVCNRRPGMLVMGEYIIRDRLGAGGMGVVYKAYDPRMQREVAIKMLLESGQQSEEKIERFRREAIAAARMNNPNIVTAYAAAEHEGYPYLVMEYVKGRDLGSLVKKGGKLPAAEAVNYMLQTARGMEYAHSRHIIHRDLKPSNLLLATPDDSDIRPGQYSRVKILDMGLARLTQQDGDVVSPALEGSDLSATGMLMGTVDYMAPEQAMDTKRADHRSDIYSLGCTLYFLLTKKPVFTGSNLLERISAHLKADIPSLRDALPGEIPEAVDLVFQKMVAKKPRDRYQSMTEVVEALERIDRQLNTSLDSITGQPLGPMIEGDEHYNTGPGSSYGSKPGSRSGSGSQGSAQTIQSGSGPLGNLPGSSYGSTLVGDEYPSAGTFVLPGMTKGQKAAIVSLIGVMAVILGAILWLQPAVKPPPPPLLPPPEPVPTPYLLPGFQIVEGDGNDASQIVPVKDRGNEYLYYDLIALDVSALPKLPAVAVPDDKKVNAEPDVENGPAFAEKPKWLVRFRLIPEGAGSELSSFYIMEDKVSRELFRAFAEANPEKIDPNSAWNLPEVEGDRVPGDKEPVFNVSVMEAYWFARWMGGKLPSPKEWDTAAGYYLPEDDRETDGPYQRPQEGEPNIAINGEPMPMDENTDDIGPFKVRFMAGNGREFTRAISTSSEISESTRFRGITGGVTVRGKSFMGDPNSGLTYQTMTDLGDKTRGKFWGTEHWAGNATSFRVVFEIPRETKAEEVVEEVAKDEAAKKE